MSQRAAPSTRSEYPLFRAIPTRWIDNDIYGHMNNVVHYSLFDTAVNAWLAESGLVDPLRGQEICLVVETGCRYFSEMAFPDLVWAGLRVGRIGTSSVRYEIGLFRNEEETAAAEGHFVHVYVDRASRSPQPLPPAFRAALAAISRA